MTQPMIVSVDPYVEFAVLCETCDWLSRPYTSYNLAVEESYLPCLKHKHNVTIIEREAATVKMVGDWHGVSRVNDQEYEAPAFPEVSEGVEGRLRIRNMSDMREMEKSNDLPYR